MKNYDRDIKYVCNLDLPWDKLQNKTVLISGASGMIGTFLIDVLMKRKNKIRVVAIGRNEEKAKERFNEYWLDPYFVYVNQDINEPLKLQEKSDYVIHAASNTHPVAYSSDPIGTIITNIIGTKNMLDYVKVCEDCRFLFLSSVEIYGENKGDVDRFSEEYCGYIDCNTLRAGYPESKRAGEALCQAYRKQYRMDAVIGRLSRTYGPTMLRTDTKAISQFIKNGAAGEDIILKSRGEQYYSYNYVADAVSGLLTILLKGKDGEAYNIADPSSDIKLKELAAHIAGTSGVKVVFELPKSEEALGYSKATKAVLDAGKLRALGWNAHWNIYKGVERTLELLHEMKEQ